MSHCGVCSVEMPKARTHYGGLSCYSCRAFFRRMTQREELARCRFAGRCTIELADRRSCPPCRYNSCLRAGMRPDLVLDDDDKKKRFRKSFLPASDYYQQQQTLPVETSSNRKTAETIFEVCDDDDEDDGGGAGEESYCEEIPGSPLTQQLDVENMLTELAQDESFIDPETGEITQPSSQPGN